MGSYLEDASGQEAWPEVQTLTNCGIAFPSPGCEAQSLSADALNASGTSLNGTTVDTGDGGGGPVLGGVLSMTSAQWCAPLDLYCKTVTDNWYDITAENAEASGFAVVEASDASGLAACAATLKCFIPVGVDWRLSAATEANVVLGVIDTVLSYTHSDRVDIVAHSQGGLIVNALVHDPASVGKIYRIVTLGTPYLGAPKVLSEVLFGTPCQFPIPTVLGLGSGCLIDPAVVQGLAENYPGVADLAPSEAYYQAIPALATVTGSTSVGLTFAQSESLVEQILAAPPSGSGLTPTTDTLMEQAATFHAQVDDWAPLDPTVGLLRMVGYDAADAQNEPDTPCSAAPCSGGQVGEYDQAGTIVSVSTSGQPIDGSGDGTVPLYSANVYDPTTGLDDRGAAHDMYWCGVSHFGLAWSTPVWQAAVSYLDGSVSYAQDLIGPGGGCPNGTDGSLTGSPLVGATIAPPAGSVAPGPASTTACSPEAAPSPPVGSSITVLNTSTTDSIDLYWEAPGCQSELYATIPAQMQLTQSAYVGDVWNLQSHSTGALLGTVSTTATHQIVIAS